MKLLHITESKNISPIKEKGILGAVPSLPHHREWLEGHYGEEKVKNNGCIYTIPEYLIQRDRYLKDFAYWKVWGQPRNERLKELTESKNYKYWHWGEYNTDTCKDIKIEEKCFKILEFIISEKRYSSCAEAIHIQDHCEKANKYWDNMDSRYEHDDKLMPVLLGDKVIKNWKIIGKMQVYNGKKINILLTI